MHALRREPGVKAGFMHVPSLPEQVRRGQPSLPQAKLIEAIAVAIEVTVVTRSDRRETAGAIA